MKKIYINENSIKSVVNGRLLPQYLFKLVKSHTTSLGDNEIFPNGDEYPFDYILLKERFNEVSDAIEELGIQDLSEDNLMSELSSLLKECKELETPIRDSLERICENAVNRLFAIPKDILNIKCKLVDKIKFKKSIRLRPESDEDIKYSFEDVQDIEFSKKAIGKRRIIDSLIQGGSYLYANVIGLYASEINKINPRLLQLYRIITAINDYLLFIKKEEMTDDKPMQGSYVETHLGMGGDRTTISAQGLIFPLLLQETIRGMFELFSAHGLPQDRAKAQYIVKKADFVLAEPWDLRFGVGLWKRVFGKVQDTNMIPYMFKDLTSLNTDEFYISMKEILSSTNKGNEIIDNLIASAEHDNGYQQFQNRINAKNLNQSLINDSYFNGAETNGYEIDDEAQEGEVIEEDGVNDSASQEIETWYRGICGSFNESLNKRQIWLAETPEYAAQYAEECEDGHLYAFDVDMSRYKDFDWYYNAPNWFEPIDGFSDEEQKELMQEGYNGYTFPLDECTVLVLFDPSLIVNVREIPLSDYLEESNSYNQQENELITESQESKSIAAAKKLVMQKFNYNEQQADEFIRIKLRNDLPVLRTPQGGKFILGVTRMFCDGQIRSANDIGSLNATLKLVASDSHINEYDRNLNNLSCQELVQRFSKSMSDNLEAEKAEVGQMVFNTPSDYEIVAINSFEEAQEFGDYTSWCVTHSEDMFDNYTNEGINQFYFCLKNGFEHIQPQPSEGCPLDEYGLSMIAVSVNENGMLNTCTCRWNHDNGGDDSVMNAKQISQVIGMNFFEVFQPNSKWSDLEEYIRRLLAEGRDPYEVFEEVGDFHEGLAYVSHSNKFNFIDEKNRLLSDQWFDYVVNFHEGFAKVYLNGKWNLINREGKFLSNQWFDNVVNFHEGFAWVQLNNKWNLINREGRLISNQWFDYVGGFSEGFACVELNNKYNFINREGKFLSNQWFDSVSNFREGFAVVRLNGKRNFINREGKFLSDKWFDYVGGFSEGFACVELNNKYNFINREGKFLSNQWFDTVSNFHEGFAWVRLNDKFNFINREGKFLSNQWFDDVGDFSEGFADVTFNGRYCKIDTNGNLIPFRESRINNGNLLNEDKQFSNVKFVGTCDSMQLYVNDNKVAYYHYKDSTARPFIIYDNRLYIGDKGKAHGTLMREIPHYDRYNENNIEGRIWVSAKVNEFNYAVVVFWGTNNTSYNCKPYVIELANKLKVNPNKIVIVIDSYDDMHPQPIQEWDGFIHEVDEGEKEAKILHMMNAKDKYDNTSGFRQTRDRKIGKKLSNDKGQEMPLAQYHNLIYQEGKKNKGIFVTEEQYKKLIENIIPIESGLVNAQKYRGNLNNKKFYYFGDCKNTVDVDNMWDATQMSQFLETCQNISPKQVIGKLNNGDRKMPNELLKAINNPNAHMSCGINEHQKIMFIYLNDNDTHYFFEYK